MLHQKGKHMTKRSWQRVIMGVMYIAAGINHFAMPRMYQAIMPPYIPWHRAMVAISGVAEVTLGVLALVPRTKRAAGWGLAALLVAVFPANLYMAQHPERFRSIPQAALWLRLPLQAVLIWWALWCTDALRPADD